MGIGLLHKIPCLRLYRIVEERIAQSREKLRFRSVGVDALAWPGRVHTAQKHVARASKVFLVAVSGHPQGQVAVQGQTVQVALQKIMVLRHGLAHGLRRVVARCGAEPVGFPVHQIEPPFVPDRQIDKVWDLPFLFANTKQVYTVLDGAASKKIFTKLEPIGVHGLMWTGMGFRNLSNSKHEI